MAKALRSERDRFSVLAARSTDIGLLKRVYVRLLSEAGIRVNGPEPWDMTVADERLWRRLALHGTLGLGESYVEGWWEVEQIDEFFARLIRARIDSRVLNVPKRLAAIRATFRNLQDLVRARRVGKVHYDLNDALYRAMLGERMIYTCAYWREAGSLDQAQEHKLELVCRKLGMERGMRVLDIGCGWGGFARYAAERYGVHVVGVTISASQAQRAASLSRGLPVEIRKQDYRDIDEKFDRIVSLGMFEHVGRKNYPTYMGIVRRSLVEDGLFLMQTIGRNDPGSGIDPWVTRYIFPNSEIPTMTRLVDALADELVVEDWHNFGIDYHRTLMAWFANFDTAWPTLSADFEPGFYRLWKYYLLMFAGVFKARGLQLWQIVASANGTREGYRRPLR